MSTDGDTDFLNVIHTHILHTEESLSCKKKKKEILPFATTYIGLEGITLREIGQGKTNTIMISLIWGI